MVQRTPTALWKCPYQFSVASHTFGKRRRTKQTLKMKEGHFGREVEKGFLRATGGGGENTKSMWGSELERQSLKPQNWSQSKQTESKSLPNLCSLVMKFSKLGSKMLYGNQWISSMPHSPNVLFLFSVALLYLEHSTKFNRKILFLNIVLQFKSINTKK